MVRSFLLFSALLVSKTIQAQCTGLPLGDLQYLQRANPDQKDNKILDLGFDLRSEFQNRGAFIRGYSKCWNTTIKQNTVYDQLIWWNQSNNSITWFTRNEKQYSSLRRSIVERKGSGKVTENPDFIVGQQFRYRFGGQKVDGIDYFFVTISSR